MNPYTKKNVARLESVQRYVASEKLPEEAENWHDMAAGSRPRLDQLIYETCCSWDL